MIITVFSDRPPDFRGILPFIKKNWLIIGEKQSRCRFSNSQVTITALFILEFNDCLASLLSGPGLAAPLGPDNIDRIESLYSFINLLLPAASITSDARLADVLQDAILCLV